MTAITINLNNGRPALRHSWPMKKDAVAVLRKLRERGLNTDPRIAIHPAVHVAWQPWVIARPDDRGEFLLLMLEDGSWVRGRLYDEPPTGGGAPWYPMGGEPIEPTFTHITHTGIFAGQPEYTRVKSNGQTFAPRSGQAAFAKCACGWMRPEDTRPEAQAAARTHRIGATP